ncbi:MAG TPA: hypothetical protein VGK73_09750 [Polyangiaceae bacterium]
MLSKVAVRASIPPSIPVEAGILSRALEVLERVETLPADAVGALRFGPEGLLLVESRAVCWAAAPGMRHRLTQLLRYEHDPPLSKEHLREVYRQCKDGQLPLVDGLLSTGKLLPNALRSALFRHTTEAIAHLASSGVRYEGFVPQPRYRARFPFSTAEILAYLGARCDPQLATDAAAVLEANLVPETSGWAFLRDAGMGAPVVVAARGSPPLPGAEMLEISSWAASLFDVTGVFDDGVRIASAGFRDGLYVVAWRAGETYFAAVCTNRAGAARLVAGLDRKLMAR